MNPSLYSSLRKAWNPWKPLPLLIVVGLSVAAIIIGLALGLGLGIGLNNDSGNLTLILSENLSNTTG